MHLLSDNLPTYLMSFNWFNLFCGFGRGATAPWLCSLTGQAWHPFNMIAAKFLKKKTKQNLLQKHYHVYMVICHSGQIRNQSLCFSSLMYRFIPPFVHFGSTIKLLLFTCKSVDCFVWCISHCSAWFSLVTPL